ncbi:MAG: M16 family metallopeptidase [Hyphomicrobium sp.]
MISTHGCKAALFRAAVQRGAAVGLAVFAMLASFTLSHPAAAMNIQQIKSPGGIEAWLVEERGVPLIALRFLFDGGNSQDPPGKDGVANFMTAMMDEGAGDVKAEAFQERMEDIAMRMSYDDSKDAFYGSVETLTANKDKAFELLKLAIQKPRFDANAVDRIRQQLIANIIYSDKDPDKVAMNAWYALAFDGHPYARRANGTEASISAVTRDDLVAYHKRTFAKNNLKVVAVGDISAEELGKILDEVFGGLPATADLLPVPKTQPVNTGKQQVIEMNVPQSVAVFGFGAMARKDPDFMPGFVVNHILGGGGFSAKLMEEVREKRGLAYSVYTYLQPYQHASILAGSVATKNEAMGESLKIIRAELKKMAENGPSQADLDAAKSYLTGSYALRFDTNSKIATQLLGLMQEGFGPDYIETRNTLIEAVSMDDVKRVAKRMLDADGLIVTIVGKPAGLDATPVAAPVAAPKRG